MTGTAFTGTAETTQFYVSGVKQETIFMNTTDAIFKITNNKGWILQNMNLYFDVGFPKGYTTIIKGQNLTLTPKLVDISANMGSMEGTIIKANVQGVGPLDNKTDVATLVDNSTGTSICEKVWMEEYGVLYCQTVKQFIDNGTVVAVKSLLNN